MDIKKDILWRVYLCFLVMILLGFVVLGKAFFIQRVQGKYWKAMGNNMHLKYMPLTAERGSIYSEDGNMLSTSVPVFDVYVDFGADGLHENEGKRFRENIDTLSTCLANLFHDHSAEEYKNTMLLAYKNEDRFFTLKKKVTFDQYTQLRNFPLVRQGRNKSGFIIDPHDKRINPYLSMFGNRTIGISRDNPKLNVGLEQSYDSLLRGSTGQRLMRYAAGAYMPVEGAEIDAENGKDIITTIDTYIQDVTEDALLNMIRENNSKHGTAIVMETATGKIKAIANIGFNDSTKVYAEDLNYGVGKATEPGSIFKLVTLMSLMEDKYVTKDYIVNCEGGSKYFYGLRIKDSHGNPGDLKVIDAFARSSNVAFAKMADQFYHNQPSQFISHIHHLRLDTMTGIDITAASGRPTIKNPSNRSWANTTIPFMAHGYELLVTPLHMLMVYNAVANNGRMMKPYLVNSVRDYGVEIKSYHPEVLVDKICSDETLAQLKECLLAVVDSAHGTAHRAVHDSSYSIAGKTGTAVTALNNKGYNKGNKIYQASFIGYFPAEHPKYTVAVVIQNSRESKLIYGADVSGKVFKQISDKIYGRFMNRKDNNWVTVNKDTGLFSYVGMKKDWGAILNALNMPYTDSTVGGYWRNLNLKNNSAGLANVDGLSNAAVMPNVVGMGLKDAIYVLENNGIKVLISGRGKVISQSVQPGTAIAKNQTINLMLN